MKTPVVMLVDDEAEFAHTLAERLELRGFDIRVATDGAEALGRLAEGVPDLVVLDVVMPGLGGIEVLRQIKARHPRLPVILLTGRGSTADGIAGMRHGALDYLTKPVDIDALVAKIREGLETDPAGTGETP